MSAILIKSNTKAEQDFILQFAKKIHAEAELLDENVEEVAILITAIEKGMKSGKAPKKEVKKFFSENGVRLQKFVENEQQFGELF